jgi:hypothetical protein
MEAFLAMFLSIKEEYNFSSIFIIIFGHQTLDLDPDSLEMLDLDPYLDHDSTNPAPRN